MNPKDPPSENETDSGLSGRLFPSGSIIGSDGERTVVPSAAPPTDNDTTFFKVGPSVIYGPSRKS